MCLVKNRNQACKCNIYADYPTPQTYSETIKNVIIGIYLKNTSTLKYNNIVMSHCPTMYYMNRFYYNLKPSEVDILIFFVKLCYLIVLTLFVTTAI